MAEFSSDEWKARRDREHEARRLVVVRAGVSHDDLVTTFRTLRALGVVDLSDLVVPPGFNLLPDGEVASVNSDTPEWQRWNDAQSLIDDADHLFGVLALAENELVLDSPGRGTHAGPRESRSNRDRTVARTSSKFASIFTR